MTRRDGFGIRGFLVVLVALFTSPTASTAQCREPPPPPAFALQDIVLVYPDGREEVGVNMVIRRGLIQAMGPGVAIPRDAKILEGDSLRVYPGLVDAHGDVALDLPARSGKEGSPGPRPGTSRASHLTAWWPSTWTRMARTWGNLGRLES